MQLNLKTVLINGEDPDPEVFKIGFGEWPIQIKNLQEGMSFVTNVYSEGFEDFSIFIQATPDDTTVYITCVGTVLDENDIPQIVSELWEITPE